MAVISRIRKHAGLLVAFIAIALLSFILGDIFLSKQSFLNSDQNVGEISGNAVSFISFENEVRQIEELQKERSRRTALDEQMMGQIRDNVWEKHIKELAFKPTFKHAGIAVSNNELKELLLGNDPDPLVIQYFSDPNTNKVYDFFVDPTTGKINPAKIKTYVDSLPPQEQGNWASFEETLRDSRLQNKYITLLKKGLTATTQQAQTEYSHIGKTVDFKFVMKSYSEMGDSTITVDDKDLLKYYNQNSYKYKQDASRKLSFVVFDLKPTAEDFQEVKSKLISLAKDWKEIKSFSEDSLFVVRESDSRRIDTTLYAAKELPIQIDSLAHASPAGTILPIYLENNEYKLCKVIKHTSVPDSVKARHILINVKQGDTLSKARAKTRIDSIKTAIKNGANFAELAKKFSEDGGSKDSGGSLGWFTMGRMVPEFQNACFYGKKGDLPIALSNYGYHLIEVLNQSNSSSKTAIATVNIKVEPGATTRQSIYNQATDFVANYHDKDAFEKGAEKLNLPIRVADPLLEGDKTIAGVENARDIVRWAYKANKGDISEPFTAENKYIVAYISQIREEGVASLDDKKEEVTTGAKKAKKAEKIIEEMTKSNAQNLEGYANKFALSIKKATDASFSAYSIPQVGRELNLYGSVFGLKENQLSKPIEGEAGVFIIQIEKIKEAAATTDYSAAKNQIENNYSYRADGEVLEAIKKKANIKDNRSKYY
jgi:peptidyl-prolyl cis-trans isomerase D